MLASEEEPTIADDELLTGTGSGGLFTSGYLRDRPLIEYLGDDERVAYLLTNTKKGVRRDGEDDRTALTPGDGYRAMLAVTDTRALFVVGDCDADGDAVVSIPYDAVEDVKSGRSVLRKYVDVWTTEGVRWRFPVRATVDVGPAASYLERAAVVWSRVESQLRHARRQLAGVSDHLAEGDHDAAREAAAAAREHVEQARRKAPDLTADRDDAVWTRIDQAETQLAEAVMRLHRSRARARVDEAQRQWRAEQYNAAYDAFLAARNQFERARDVAAEHGFDALSDLRAAADEVTHELDRLSKAPLARAETAHERARAAASRARTAEHLEAALESYQTALVLDWGNDDHRFAGDSARLRETVESIVAQLVAVRRELADRHRSAGERLRAEGATEPAQEAFAAARDELDAALAVAEELRPDLVDDVEADRAALAERFDDADGPSADPSSGGAGESGRAD